MQDNIEKLSRNPAYSGVFALIILSCLGVIIYSNTLDSSFQFDDYNSIVFNPSIRNPANLGTIWNFWPTRFITYLSFALNYHLNQLNVFNYHLFNLIVHLVCAILVWWLVLLTFSTPTMKDAKITPQANLIAFFAGLVFLAHPIQTQAVTYIIQRATSLAALFYLASVALYAKSRLLQLETQVRGSYRFYYAGSLITAVLAMFTKEMTITLPMMILLYEFCFLKTEKGINWKQLIPFLITLLIIPLTMFLSKSVNFQEMRRIAEPAPNIFPWHYLLTQFRVMVIYLRLLFLPLNQNLDYDYPIAKSLLDLPTLASLLLLMLILIIAIRICSRYKLISFAIFWFFLALLPESSLIPIKDVIYEHRLYLPMVGFSLFLISIIYYSFGKNNIKPMVFILFIVITCYSILTYQRNFIWKDELSLWNDTVSKSPKKARAYNNRGLAYQTHGNLDQAISDYNNAIEISPNLFEAYSNRGLTYQTQGNLKQAMSDYNKAIELKPNFAEAYSNRGIAYQTQGNLKQAMSDYNKAIELNPNYADAYNNRGLIYQTQGNLKQAMSDYNKAIELNPNYADAYTNRGLIYQTQGNLNQAISDFNKAIAIDPNYDQAYNNRGNIYRTKGNLNQAISDFNKAIEINPNFAQAYNNRGIVYQAQGNLNQAISDYNKVIEIYPDYALAYNNRAVAYFYKKEYSKSWEDVYKAETLGWKFNPGFLQDLKKASGR
jgi:tetratricopeptide (TPR) repeat protein